MDIRSIEYMLMRSWPALKQEIYDGWILRTSNGYTKRANSISPYYESFFEHPEKFQYCEEYFKLRNLPVIYRLIEDENCISIDKELEDLGYRKEDLTSVQGVKLIGIKFDAKGMIIENQFSRYWFEFFSREMNMSKKDSNTLEMILKKNDSKNFYVLKKEKDRIVAGGLGVIEGDKLGIYNIYVCPSVRGKGYGEEVVKRIMLEGRGRNVDYAYLQVEVSNTKAMNLYNKLGFKELYKYWYRIKP